MPIPDDSVGLVESQTLHFDQPLTLACGKTIPKWDITYETYGELNADHSNAVLICHALSGDHHAAGYHNEDDKKPGWWENAIGPGKPIDTNQFFVVALNNIGHCKGSTGPASINPETGKMYGPDFPIVTVTDWVKTQRLFSDKLEIQTWAAIIGGSLGGMQVMQWAIDYPNDLKHAIIIAAAPKLSAQNIGFNEVSRQAILSDPDFHEGHYIEKGTVPKRGLMLARMLGHITYLSDDAMRKKFGRELRSGKINYGFDVEFQVESYLRYQGTSFVDRFDANTYLLMTKALDYFDPAQAFDGDLVKAFKQIKAQCFVVSFTSDWRFAPERSQEIVHALVEADKVVSYAEIEAHQGHDAFLLPLPDYMNLFYAYMSRVAKDIPA
ncbi:MAG: homoserine O-acetyltransferase [Methylococcales bacterium]|jgi:homoserine O-acetyltransferase/O-succinyltransferase|nr:homoserine O-acetyltransferase [Methylococcales bacterium]MBT7444591.1 homoserine O-acetyltransferase [Methylococcales bacterium]